VNTLRRTFESFTHFNCPTCYAVQDHGTLHLYGYADVAAVYLTVPCEGTGLSTRLPVAHLVKVLNTCVTNSIARLSFLADHLRVENEVEYRVEYVKGVVKALEYPTVQPCQAYIVGLGVMHRFLKLVDDTVTLHEGLEMRASYQGIVKSKLTFPLYDDVYIHFGVPLVTKGGWPEEAVYTADLMRQLCRTQSFQTTGVLVVCKDHCVYTSERNGIVLKVCFTRQ
jgi:hypothetical protein